MTIMGFPQLEREYVIPSKELKGPLSFDSCKNCRSQCEHAGKERIFLYRDKSCKVTVVTNADRIRAMSDEELAWELMTWRVETEAKHHGVSSNYPNTQKTILEWLKQSVEVNDNG